MKLLFVPIRAVENTEDFVVAMPRMTFKHGFLEHMAHMSITTYAYTRSLGPKVSQPRMELNWKMYNRLTDQRQCKVQNGCFGTVDWIVEQTISKCL